tara:strand:+ start:4435 stop:4692 length:258 start_codon:yes stop_codon:yes gene_type:complete
MIEKIRLAVERFKQALARWARRLVRWWHQNTCKHPTLLRIDHGWHVGYRCADCDKDLFGRWDFTRLGEEPFGPRISTHANQLIED